MSQLATAPNATEPVAGEIVERPRTFQPNEPVGNASELKRLLELQRESIAQALPRHVTPERLIKTMMVAVNRVPELLACTKMSVLETINRAAELGLDLSGTLGEAYPVPFKGMCQLIIGYRGLAKLAWQSGEVKRIETDVIHAKDKFTFRKGLNATLDFEPAWQEEDRGEVIGAYALVELKGGGLQYDFMSKAQIEKIRKGAPSSNSPAWSKHWEEMAKKTVLRRVMKLVPLSTEKYVKAMEYEGADYALADAALEVDVEPDGRTRSAKLLDQLKGGNGKPAADANAPGPDATGLQESVDAAKSKAAAHDAAFPAMPDPKHKSATQRFGYLRECAVKAGCKLDGAALASAATKFCEDNKAPSVKLGDDDLWLALWEAARATDWTTVTE